jgi:hypothetical protein
MTKTITMADLFCGAGGTSTGAVEAVEMLGAKAELTAINHWPGRRPTGPRFSRPMNPAHQSGSRPGRPPRRSSTARTPDIAGWSVGLAVSF